MPAMPRLSQGSRVLLSSLLLCGACSDDGGTEAGNETGDETGTPDPDASVFFPPGTKLIPAGNVWRGCIEGDGSCDSDEEPGGMVQVSAFFIDRTEANARSYGECVNDDVCTNPMNSPDCNLSQGRLDHPINCLSYDMAKTYCEWRGMRLPTEAEWERAARGDAQQLYPWGDEAPDCTRAHLDECGNSSSAVGSLPDGDSPFGIADMVGNVSEWVSDYYDDGYYAASAGADDPQGPDSGSERVLKGSAFTVPSAFPANRISKRNFATPESAIRIYGVRCARDR
jgi:iron(II)-dependent oxidoreductase